MTWAIYATLNGIYIQQKGEHKFNFYAVKQYFMRATSVAMQCEINRNDHFKLTPPVMAASWSNVPTLKTKTVMGWHEWSLNTSCWPRLTVRGLCGAMPLQGSYSSASFVTGELKTSPGSTASAPRSLVSDDGFSYNKTYLIKSFISQRVRDLRRNYYDH